MPATIKGFDTALFAIPVIRLLKGRIRRDLGIFFTQWAHRETPTPNGNKHALTIQESQQTLAVIFFHIQPSQTISICDDRH